MLKLILGLLLCSIILGKEVLAQQDIPGKPPNIIVIYTDDHQWDVLGASGNSNNSFITNFSQVKKYRTWL